MKIAPSVATLAAGFPNPDQHIDTFTGKPERLGLNALIEAITENAAAIETLKGGGRYGHMAFCMSVGKYTSIHHTQPFVMELNKLPPTSLTFGANYSAAVREDKKLLYYNKVYNFELETI